ncbi:MAG: TonB-dependent receptor [Bacteroidales bacterium]|nr:TonB-dependent receptor [Bacteroidales bacterium]
MRFLIIAILSIVSISISFPQNFIDGIIRDYVSNDKLPGVNIYIPELHKGTISDTNGYYSISGIPDGQFNIQYSFIGYKTHFETILFRKNDITKDITIESSAIEAQEVIITGGKVSTQHENAIKIEQVKIETLDNSTEKNLLSKLAELPGIDAITKGNGIATPVIRGLSTSNIVVLNNGVRMENFQFSENHPYLLDASDISKIEIIKGPASLLYGSDAVGGVLNLIREHPAPVKSLHISCQSEFNSNDKGITNQVGIKTSRENYWGGINAYHTTSQDYTDGKGNMAPNSRNTYYSMKVNSGIRSRNGIFIINYEYAKSTPGLTIPPAIELIENNSYKNKVWYQNLDNHLFTSNNTLFFNKLKLDADISYQDNHRKLEGSELSPAHTMVDMHLQTLSYQLKTKYNFSDKSSAILAYQGLFQTNHNGPAPQHVLPDYTSNSNSIAGLWQYNFNARTFYQAGFRYDYKDLDIPSQLTSDNAVDSIKGFNKWYSNISFSSGFTYKFSGSILFRANIASAYRTPTISELSQDGIHGDRYEQGNANLVSQRNLEGDISLHYHSNKIKYEIAGFYNRIFDYIFLSPTADTTADGIDIYRYLQNNSTIYGMESEIEWQPVTFLTILANYSHIIAQQDGGYNLPFIPQDKIHGQIIVTKLYKGFLHELHVSLNPLFAFTQNNPHQFEDITESYFITNTYINTKLKYNHRIIECGLFIHNLFDNAYQDHLSTLKEVGYYNMGRNITIKLKVPLNFKVK